MKRLVTIALLALAAASGCHHATPTETGTGVAVPIAPDHARLEHHLRAHVSYPADRAAILAACAQTDEFTPEEKAFIAEHLPHGTYASADDVLAAMQFR